MGQSRDVDHREDAPHFTSRLQGGRTSVRGIAREKSENKKMDAGVIENTNERN